MGFGQGLSGLNAAAQTLDIIGNNIANSGTVGFKASTATFADVYASSKVGLGVQVASVNQRFTIGTVTGTGNQFDMAIDGAKGLFRLQEPSGSIVYSRNGQFFANAENYIVNAQGQRLTGYAPGSTNPTPIMVPTGNIAPQATDNIDFKANFNANAPAIYQDGKPATLGVVELTPSAPLGAPSQTYYYGPNATGGLDWYASAASDTPDAAAAPGGATGGTFTATNANGEVVTIEIDGTSQLTSGALPVDGTGNSAFVPAIAAIPFDPTNGNSFTHSQPIDVYDSLGNGHQLMQYFVKREGTGDTSNWDVYYSLNGAVLSDSSNLTFDDAGRMTNPGFAVDLNIPNPGGINSPAENLEITLRYDGSTQFGGSFSPDFVQNGYSTGEYASMSIAKDGSIMARYTNGQMQSMGTLVLADFNNLQGLQPAGGNAWIETSESGQPILGVPGANGLATLMGQAVEESNVDMSQELVNMIIAQRTYQANAQTIKTQDQILQTLITMR